MAWSNVVLDGKVLRSAGKSEEPFDIAAKRWDAELPAKGKLQLDVLLLPEAACSWVDEDGNLGVGVRQPLERESTAALSRAQQEAASSAASVRAIAWGQQCTVNSV